MPTAATLQRRDTLRTRLVSVAEETIKVHGVRSLKARDLASAAECSVGAIYNVFGDLSDLILEVNSRTFSKMAEEVAGVVPSDAVDPTEELVALSQAYLTFAQAHTNQWRALFEADMGALENIPKWYIEQFEALLGEIGRRVAHLHPDMPEDTVRLLSHTLFSAVHGMVLLGLEGRRSGIPAAKLGDAIAASVRSLAKTTEI